MSAPTVAFLGCGRITRAIVTGLVASGLPAQRLYGVSRHGRSALALAADTGLTPASDIAGAVRPADLVAVAVHPHEAADVLAGLRPLLRPGQLLVSLVASWPAAAVARAVGDAVPVVRAVPNVAAAVQAGATVLSAGPGAGQAELERVSGLFERLGRVLVAADEHMEAVSALSGAGPALLARFAQALAQAAAGLGLPQRLAEDLARHAVHGTGVLHARPGASLAGTVAAVSSPGGMTEQALATLDRHGLAPATTAALRAAVALSLTRTPNPGPYGDSGTGPGPGAARDTAPGPGPDTAPGADPSPRP
ncbi:pyrroline-5-carboxylate reductase dimerization domain-containing protein [Streptomyces sp. NPDC093260]|uniref:pyrroline-5-carboxylate reductase family protein n=1 Tax=Streptomyces sp. NPDC093260 TaxID=3155073 RepID=UPI0034414AD0